MSSSTTTIHFATRRLPDIVNLLKLFSSEESVCVCASYIDGDLTVRLNSMLLSNVACLDIVMCGPAEDESISEALVTYNTLSDTGTVQVLVSTAVILRLLAIVGRLPCAWYALAVSETGIVVRAYTAQDNRLVGCVSCAAIVSPDVVEVDEEEEQEGEEAGGAGGAGNPGIAEVVSEFKYAVELDVHPRHILARTLAEDKAELTIKLEDEDEKEGGSKRLAFGTSTDVLGTVSLYYLLGQRIGEGLKDVECGLKFTCTASKFLKQVLGVMSSLMPGVPPPPPPQARKRQRVERATCNARLKLDSDLPLYLTCPLSVSGDSSISLLLSAMVDEDMHEDEQ